MTRRVSVVQLGVGQVGREVVSIVRAQAPVWRERYDVAVRYVALADSTGFVAGRQSDDAPIALPLAAALDARAGGRRFAPREGAAPPEDSSRALDEALSGAGSPADLVVVDCAAGRGTTPFDLRARERGAHLVLANKDPLTGPYGEYARLVASPAGGSLRRAATVGAGLPILAAVDALIASGDAILTLDARASGSLGFLCDRLSHGDSFDTALREAMARGYTEPDPRQDLSGFDVARKLLILARAAGRRAELADIRVESLVPPGYETAPPADFLAALPAFARHLADRANSARAEGQVLRYVGRVDESGALSAGLVALPPGDALAYGAGPDNIFVLRSDRYAERPLVIAGPGAGARVTAGAVVADLLRAIGVL